MSKLALSALLDSFPNNTSRDINPVDVRNFVDSVFLKPPKAISNAASLSDDDMGYLLECAGTTVTLPTSLSAGWFAVLRASNASGLSLSTAGTIAGSSSTAQNNLLLVFKRDSTTFFSVSVGANTAGNTNDYYDVPTTYTTSSGTDIEIDLSVSSQPKDAIEINFNSNAAAVTVSLANALPSNKGLTLYVKAYNSNVTPGTLKIRQKTGVSTYVDLTNLHKVVYNQDPVELLIECRPSGFTITRLGVQIVTPATSYADAVSRVTTHTQIISLRSTDLFKQSTTPTGITGNDPTTANEHDGIKNFVYELQDKSGSYVLFTLNEVERSLDFFRQDGDTDAQTLQRALDQLEAGYDATKKEWPFSLSLDRNLTITTDVNATGIRSDYIPWFIKGNGYQITCVGAKIDLLDSRRLILTDCIIRGSGSTVPVMGMQIGRNSSNRSADSHSFQNVFFVGEFTRSGLYNLASENLTCINCHFENDYNNVNALALVQDGNNGYGALSSFQTVLSGEQNLSFNENKFVGCQFLKRNSGSAVFLSNTKMHEYHGYAFTYNDSCFIINNYGEGVTDAGHRNLVIDVHSETQVFSPGIQNNIKFIGGNSTTTIKGFKLVEHGMQAENAIFAKGGSVANVYIYDADISIAGIAGNEPGTGTLFDTPSAYHIQGKIALLDDADQLNLSGIGHFSGHLYVKNAALKTHAPGEYFVHDATHTYVAGALAMLPKANGRAQFDVYDSSFNLSGSWGVNTVNDRGFYSINGVEKLTVGDGFFTLSALEVWTGTVSPNSNVTAPVGSLYVRTGTGQGELWQKRLGTGNTGWVLMQGKLLSGTITASETTLAHGLGYTPEILGIVAKGSGYAWQSTDPDGTNIYLTASTSVDVDVWVK